jgi:3-oxoacyl-[acyl-carrier protein] reductase
VIILFCGDEIAIVTGASKGIGKAIAIDLAKSGITTILTYVSSKKKMDETLLEIETFGGKAVAFKMDVSDEKQVKQLFKDVKKQFRRLDILVNNSGITKDGFLPLMSSAKWDDVVNINLRGTFLCSREAVKQMMINKKGVIINIASTSGISGVRGQVNYSASKGGIISFTKSLALEVAEHNIRANVVAPGFIETDMTKGMDQATLSKMSERIPLKRMGKPEDVAGMVSFLCSERAAYITGKVHIIDGGLIT